MKIRTGTIAKIAIILFALMNLCYFSIAFSGTSLFADSFVSKPRMLLFLILILASLVFCIPYSTEGASKYMMFEMVILAVIWCRIFIGCFLQNYVLEDIVGNMGKYFYPIMAFALLKLFLSGRWKLQDMMKFLVIVITIDTIVRALNSLVEASTGALLWQNIVLGESGYRNGIYRINPTGFDILVIPMAFYLINTKEWKKGLWWSCLLINCLYTLFIWQARSATIYKICVLVLCFFFQKVSDRKKGIRILIGVVAAVILVITPFVNNYLGTFSASDPEHGGSTVARLNAIDSFLPSYLKNIFWGIGLLTTAQRRSIDGGALEDCGFLFGIFQYGVPMILFYLALFGRGFYVAYKLRTKSPEESLLCLSLTALFVMFGINIDTFYMFAMAVPFYMATVEYLYHRFRYRMEELEGWDSSERNGERLLSGF